MSNTAQNRHTEVDGRAAPDDRQPEITREPTVMHSPEVMDLKMRAIRCVHARSYDEAESLFRSMLELEPRSPDALHNLAALEFQRGDPARAEQSLQELARKFPAYGFARIGLAQLCLRDGRLHEAGEWLDSLRDRRLLNDQEYAAILHVQGKLAAARGDYAAARECLVTLEGVAPRHAGVCELRELTASVPG